jgi:hypothetical protein
MPKSSAAGFMSIEQFIEFFEDSAILHVSRVVWADVFWNVIACLLFFALEYPFLL